MTYDGKLRTAFIVHWEEFGLPNMIFDMHSCRLHVYYPEQSNGQYGFVLTVTESMRLFTKQQIEGVLKVCHLYKTLVGYPSNAVVKAVLQVGGIGGCTVTVDNAKVAYRI